MADRKADAKQRDQKAAGSPSRLKERAQSPLKHRVGGDSGCWHKIGWESFEREQGTYFLKKILVPYLSSVFSSLIANGTKDYMSTPRTKHYLNLPEQLGQTIVGQINANGDERIDHDEFIGFMLQVLMGTKLQKMMIAFNCYDIDGDQRISADEVRHVLQHIPLRMEARYGASFGLFEQEANMSKHQLLKAKNADLDQISMIAEVIFSEYPDGIYFDEFVQLGENVTSELVYPVFDCLYQCVPCI